MRWIVVAIGAVLGVVLVASACTETCDALETSYTNCTCTRTCNGSSTTTTPRICNEDVSAAKASAESTCRQGCAGATCACTCAESSQLCQQSEVCR